jgi:hypothetical protein
VPDDDLPELPLGGALFYESIEEPVPGYPHQSALVRDMESGGGWLVDVSLLRTAAEDVMDALERMVLRYRGRMSGAR